MRNVLPSLPYKNLNVLSISKELHDYIVLNAYLVMYVVSKKMVERFFLFPKCPPTSIGPVLNICEYLF